MTRITIVLILLGITSIGFLAKLLSIRKINQRLEYTVSYHDDFLELYEQIRKSGKYDEQLYYKLMQDEHKIQNELGVDGIVSIYQDPLAGFQIKNYPLFLNFYNELRTQMMNYPLFAERLYLFVGSCDEALVKHIGILKEAIQLTKKDFVNPVACFSYGINIICSIPVKILEWCKIITVSSSGRILGSKLHLLISKTITLIGLFGSIITIVLGWDEVTNFLQSIVLLK